MKQNNEHHHFLQRTVAVCFLAMVCCLLWGSAFPCIKTGYEMFEIDAADTASQILFAGVRFALAALILVCAGIYIVNREDRG